MKSNKMGHIFHLTFVFALIFSLASCKKYLEVKPNIALEVPSSIQDLDALLDNTSNMNKEDAGLGQNSSDEFYEDSSVLQTRSLTDQELYSWDASVIKDNWYTEYRVVYVANNVLDNLGNVSGVYTVNDYNRVKGEALFFRGFAFYNLAQEYSPIFSSENSSSPYGVCLRLSSDVSEQSVRATVAETYGQIIYDLTQASLLLPAASSFPTIPNRKAAFGALARVYLAMQDYANAEKYSDSCLNLDSVLVDYNTINLSVVKPFSRFNAEVIFHSEYNYGTTISRLYAKIDSNLISAYSSNDLRLAALYVANPDGSYGFKGDYSGSGSSYPSFDGIAVDEMYLIKAECMARLGDFNGAIGVLNRLLVWRWQVGTFVPYTANGMADAIYKILLERRKELVMRNLRWTDLKRLNLDPLYAITLTRDIDGVIYTLPPGDLRYSFLIPLTDVSIGKIPQNPR